MTVYNAFTTFLFYICQHICLIFTASISIRSLLLSYFCIIILTVIGRPVAVAMCSVVNVTCLSVFDTGCYGGIFIGRPVAVTIWAVVNIGSLSGFGTACYSGILKSYCSHILVAVLLVFNIGCSLASSQHKDHLQGGMCALPLSWQHSTFISCHWHVMDGRQSGNHSSSYNALF